MRSKIKRFIAVFLSSLSLVFSPPRICLSVTTVAAGIIIAWPGTAGAIPSGWARNTNLDTFYIQGAPTSGDADLTARGSANHLHTITDHTHTGVAHTHTFSAGTPTDTDLGLCCSITAPSSDTHTHASTTSNSATITYQNGAVTLNTTSNDPPFVKVIWIESDGTPTGIPSNAYAFFSSDTLPSSWTRVQGNKYLKGADAGGDGGGTGGSSDAHTHTETAVHGHTADAHTHSAKASAGGGTGAVGHTAGVGAAVRNHTHSVSLNTKTTTVNTASISLGNSNGEPVFKKLNIINNGTGGADLPNNVIALWGSTNASIPTDWTRFTSMDGNFLKGANANGESNVTTGGSTTHTHTEASGHNHTESATHNHGSTAGLASGARQPDLASADTGYALDTHTHTWTIGNTTATMSANALTTAANTSENAYPPYKRLIFVQFASAEETSIKDVIMTPGIVVRTR